jgi:3-hydroxybutyryl-CoA dehydratase
MNRYRWPDLSIGLREQFEVTLTEEMATMFGELSGDNNPLHVDKEYAIQAGFDGPVIFGLLTSSFYSRLVGVYLPGRYALLHGIDIDFVSPAYVGDTLTIEGEIAFLGDAYKRLEIKGRIRNKKEDVVSKAKIRVGLRDG